MIEQPIWFLRSIYRRGCLVDEFALRGGAKLYFASVPAWDEHAAQIQRRDAAERDLRSRRADDRAGLSASGQGSACSSERPAKPMN